MREKSKSPLKYHNEIILRFDKGQLSDVIIDGERIADAVRFAIDAHCRATATFVVERSAAYSESE